MSPLLLRIFAILLILLAASLFLGAFAFGMYSGEAVLSYIVGGAGGLLAYGLIQWARKTLIKARKAVRYHARKK